MSDQHAAAQAKTCARFGARPSWPKASAKVGISRGALAGEAWPLHGLRHPPEADTNGWYFWTGELSDDPDFFVALHVGHLYERSPIVLPYLALPPGWRILLAPDAEDVWFDGSLLELG